MGDKLSGKAPRLFDRRGNCAFDNPSEMELFATEVTRSLPQKATAIFCLCQERIKPETRALRTAFSPTHCTPRPETGQTRHELNSSPVPTFSEAAGVVSTVRIERGPSNSLYFSLGEWPRLPFTARVIPIPPFTFKGSLVDPRLRASNEHIRIVRVPRAGGRPGYPSHPSEAARCASTEDHQAPSPPLLREQGISTDVIPPLSWCARSQSSQP